MAALYTINICIYTYVYILENIWTRTVYQDLFAFIWSLTANKFVLKIYRDGWSNINVSDQYHNKSLNFVGFSKLTVFNIVTECMAAKGTKIGSYTLLGGIHRSKDLQLKDRVVDYPDVSIRILTVKFNVEVGTLARSVCMTVWILRLRLSLSSSRAINPKDLIDVIFSWIRPSTD